MAILHLLNKSPFTHNVIQSCIHHCQPGDAVIFIEDGVLNILPGSPFAEQINNLKISGVSFYALAEDIAARGIENQLRDEIISINYTDFVRLSVEHSPIQSWY